MHVTEVGASDAGARTASQVLPFAYLAIIDLLFLQLLPYPATHIRHLRQDGLRQRQTIQVVLGLAC
jgi:hypothetical protein